MDCWHMAEGWLVCTMQQLTTVRRNAWAMWKKWGGGKGEEEEGTHMKHQCRI